MRGNEIRVSGSSWRRDDPGFGIARSLHGLRVLRRGGGLIGGRLRGLLGRRLGGLLLVILHRAMDLHQGRVAGFAS
jgi:hypothetical protein